MEIQPDYIDRGIADFVVTAMAEARVVAILGARQAGKTTLAQVLAERDLGAGYVTLDTEAVRSLAESDPDGFVAGLKTPIVIDEIQRVPALLIAIKAVVDQDDRRGQFLITGSANLRRIPMVVDALPGRVDYRTLWPLAQAEIEGTSGRLLPRLFAGRPPLLARQPVGIAAHAERLIAGGLPESLRRSDATRQRFLRDYAESVVERDLAETSRVRDPAAVAQTLLLIAARSAGLARWDQLGRDTAVDGKTAKAQVEALERLYLVRVRRPWRVNLGKRQVKAPKLYIADSGLQAALTGTDAARLASNPGIAGSMVETFVVNEVERLASWTEPAVSLWHYREDRREVDLIAESPSGDIVAIKVKSSAGIRARDFSGLVHLKERLGDRFKAGVVVHLGSQTLPRGDRLWALPITALWTDPVGPN